MIDPAEFAEIAARHRPETVGPSEWCVTDVMDWPCDAFRLLAHIARLDETLVVAYEAGAADQRARGREAVRALDAAHTEAQILTHVSRHGGTIDLSDEEMGEDRGWSAAIAAVIAIIDGGEK